MQFNKAVDHAYLNNTSTLSAGSEVVRSVFGRDEQSIPKQLYVVAFQRKLAIHWH
jgi:hypothetical protein